MFGIAKTHNSNVWKSQKERIPMFGIKKILNSNLWKSQNSQFHCLEKGNARIAIFC